MAATIYNKIVEVVKRLFPGTVDKQARVRETLEKAIGSQDSLTTVYQHISPPLLEPIVSEIRDEKDRIYRDAKAGVIDHERIENRIKLLDAKFAALNGSDDPAFVKIQSNLMQWMVVGTSNVQTVSDNILRSIYTDLAHNKLPRGAARAYSLEQHSLNEGVHQAGEVDTPHKRLLREGYTFNTNYNLYEKKEWVGSTSKTSSEGERVFVRGHFSLTLAAIDKKTGEINSKEIKLPIDLSGFLKPDDPFDRAKAVWNFMNDSSDDYKMPSGDKKEMLFRGMLAQGFNKTQIEVLFNMTQEFLKPASLALITTLYEADFPDKNAKDSRLLG